MSTRNHNLSLRTFLLLALLTLKSVSALAQNPVADFTANVTSGCAPLSVQFTDLSSGTPLYWNWDFGNGQLSNVQNPVATFSTPGTYTITLVVRNAAGIDQEIKTNYIVVAASPTANFNPSITTACAPATIQFSDLSTPAGNIVSWDWSFGDGATSTLQNPSHTYTTPGFYSVVLTVTSASGCTNTNAVTNLIRIVPGIAAGFTFQPPVSCTAPFSVTFQDQSSGPGAFTYNWNFGHGGPGSTASNPVTTYPAPGNYTVQLDVQSNLGCSGSVQQTITIAGATTDFNAPAVICSGQPINFTNASTPAPVFSFWDFGDGNTSAQVNPVKTYLTPGTYNVKLINQYASCTDSVTKTVTVTLSPVIDFTASDSNSCAAPFTVQFTDNTPGATAWQWNFGDGGTSTLQNPSHTYAAFGSYDVTLTVTTAGGCTGTLVKPGYINIARTQITLSNAPAGGCIPFTFSPVTNIQTADPIVSWAWDLGEAGATYNVQNPTHTYLNAGTYTVTLTVTTQSGCIETFTFPNAVRTGTPPVVNFSYNPLSPICANTNVTFTDLTTGTSGAVVYSWNFGDGTGSFLQNPVHQFIDTGLVVVTLSVSNNGCPAASSQTLQILPPVADFTYALNCNNRLQVFFTDGSLADPAYGPITYEWHMGDPANTVITGVQNPVFTYPTFGTYNVTLIVTNGACVDSTTVPVFVGNDIADFTISKNPVCRNENFTLTAINSNPGVISSYTWTIGANPPFTGADNYSTSLPANGTYDVTLTLVDQSGCILTKTVPNYITVTGPTANFTTATPGACLGQALTFNDLSTPAGTITSWQWNFGDGPPQTYTAPPFTHTYSQPGSYFVTLTVTGAAGCTDSYNPSSTGLLVTKPIPGFRAPTFYCPGTPLQFTDTSSGVGLTYLWSFGDGGTSTLQNPTHSYPAGDNDYTVKLVITDISGCKDSVTKTNYIQIRRPKASFTLIDTAGLCPPYRSRFTFTGQDYQSLLWSFGDGATSTLQNPTHFYNQYGTYIPKLYLTGPGGCMDSAQAVVNVYNPITSTQIQYAPTSACNSLTVNFNITSPPGFKFHFNFGDGTLDTSQQKILSHFYTAPGIYYPGITLFDSLSCTAAVAAGPPVIVYGAVPLFGKDRKEFCDQGTVFFTNFTQTNDPIISSVWDFGDGTTTSTTSPSHNFTAPGTYVISLTVTTQNLCTSRFTDTVRVYRTPVVSILSRDTICVNVPELFNGNLAQADTAIAWQWSMGNGTSGSAQNNTSAYNTPGPYNVQLIASNKLGCADTATKTIYVSPSPTATPVTDPIIIPVGTTANLNMNYTNTISTYLWTPGQTLSCVNCPTPAATPKVNTTYTVNLTDINGCTGRGSITVEVLCGNKNFFIPNLFSPNGDGSNDVFYPRGLGLFRIKNLRILNRWGEVVFERREFPANDPAMGWDGKYKGKQPMEGVYVYQIEIYCDNGQLIQLAGNVALML